MPGPDSSPESEPSSAPPAYVPIAETSVRLQVNNPKKEYTNGDTVSGCLILEVSEHKIHISGAKAYLRCTETIDCIGPEQRIDATLYSQEKRLMATDDFGHEVTYGIHKFPFTFILDSAITKCPPTFKFRDREDYCEVNWKLEALIVECDSTEEEASLKATTKLRVYPLDRKAEFSRYGNGGKGALSGDLEDPKMLYYPKFKIELTGLPKYVPQPPEVFYLQLCVIPYEPVVLGKVKIVLQFTVILTTGLYQLCLCKPHYVTYREYDQAIKPNQPPLICTFKCALKRTTAAPFKLSNIDFRCDLLVYVNADASFEQCRLTSFNIASPPQQGKGVER